ncbi:MAG TPA: hypothetical protein VFT57_00220 [Gemmatimonadaceae bacterium]|nr:hypothetical protein [Gemmatimonadaceae bacterium]
MRNIHLALVTLCTFLLIGCASASGGSSSGASGSAAKSSSDQSHLTSEEIVAANLPTAYDLVDRLRRPWLRRDAATGKDVVVYMDQQNIGGAAKLRDIPSVDVAELEYLPYDQAVQRWGSQVEGSVIVVTRRR